MCEDENAHINMATYVANYGYNNKMTDHVFNYRSSSLSMDEITNGLNERGSCCCWVGYAVAKFPEMAVMRELHGGLRVDFPDSSINISGVSYHSEIELWQYLFGSMNPNSASMCGLRLLGLLSPQLDSLESGWPDMISREHTKIMIQILDLYDLDESFLFMDESESRAIIIPLLREKLKAYDHKTKEGA